MARGDSAVDLIADQQWLTCPICRCAPSLEVASAAEIRGEIDMRREFFLRRIAGPVDVDEWRDVTEVTRSSPAPILWCETCDVLVRADGLDPVRIYSDERYSRRSLAILHRAHVAEFRARRWLKDLLPRGANVLEIGSYAGGFLTAAAEWGWTAAGVDINADVVAFSRDLGLNVIADLGSGRPPVDGVFVWNCFEQLPDPAATLLRVRKLIRPGGLLVIRTPDAALYRHRTDRQAIAYNGLLGFPHRFGFSAESLRRIADGFGVVSIRRAGPIRPLCGRLCLADGWLEASFRTAPLGHDQRLEEDALETPHVPKANFGCQTA